MGLVFLGPSPSVLSLGQQKEDLSGEQEAAVMDDALWYQLLQASTLATGKVNFALQSLAKCDRWVETE